MKHSSGQTIIEILLTIAISLIFLPALFIMFFVSREGRGQERLRTQAIMLNREGEEIIRNIREKGWTQFEIFSNNVIYRPTKSGSTWTLSAGEETIPPFTRSIVFSEVLRDNNGGITTTGGTPDPSTRRVTVTVSWNEPIAAMVSTSMLITRHESIVVVDTTVEDFTAATHTHTQVRSIGDGDVVLGNTGGLGDWCQPTLSISALDLPKSGVANAISAIQGQIAVGTGDNASGVSYANVLLTDPAAPTNPSASVSGTFDGYKTNDVFTENNYAYVATDNNGEEIVIVDLTSKDSNNKYQKIGWFNAPGNGDGDAVAVSGNTGFMISGNKLYAFDVTSKSNARTNLDSDGVTLPGAGTAIMIRGSLAFVTTTSTSAQVVIISINNPTNLTISDTISVSGQGGVALYVNSTGSRTYLVTGQSSSQREFFIINTQAGSGGYKSVLSAYDTNGMNPTGIVTVSGPRAIIVGTGAEEYQVVDITNEQAAVLPRCGGLEINTGINGIATVFTSAERAYSYIITGDSTSELKIIEGGPGSNGSEYFLTGQYDSRIFDASMYTTNSQVAFNRFSANITKSSGLTDLQFQFAAADPVSGSCADAIYTFIGPDGTSSSYYTTTEDSTSTGAIPFDNDGSGFENPARCFRYRAYLSTTDITLTPRVADVSISFSP